MRKLLNLSVAALLPLAFGACEEAATTNLTDPGAQVAAADGAGGPSGVFKETVDVFGQGLDGDVVAEDGATLRRTPNGISVKVSMPTPEPGDYQYPDPSPTATDEEGPPEAFTLWVFVFDDPESKDFTGAFLGAGHVVDGPNLTLSGRVSKKTEPFVGEPLSNPGTAEVHLAVAPHGALDPELMPGQIQTPSGPGPDVWWLAFFEALD